MMRETSEFCGVGFYVLLLHMFSVLFLCWPLNWMVFAPAD